NSVAAEGSSPRTRPTCSSSSPGSSPGPEASASGTRLPTGSGDGGADPAQHEIPVAEQVPQPPLQGGDGDQVLGRARVPEAQRREPRQVPGGHVGKLHDPRDGQRGADLAAGDAGPGVTPGAVGEAQVPRVVMGPR